MISVVDKKVIKHLYTSGTTMVEVPIRLKFEYQLHDHTFVSGSMQREYLYNREALISHCPQIDIDLFEAQVMTVVDQSLMEHLRYSRQAEGDIDLYGSKVVEPVEEVPLQELVMPGDDQPPRDDVELILPKSDPDS